MSDDAPNKVTIEATRRPEHWDLEVLFDGQWVGGGTSRTADGVLDVAADVLFGDMNDALNDYYGALGDVVAAERKRDAA